MFTGIIQEIARVEKIALSASIATLGFRAKIVSKTAGVSDSIAINGVCLTVVKRQGDLLLFEAVRSTIEATNVKRFKKGSIVNLEPALKVGEKIGGHFVLGHVDKEVKLKRKIKFREYQRIEVELPVELKKYIFSGGSVALDGISLTIKMVTARSFTVDVIPFTYEHTNLKYRKPGDWLNLECDYLLKRGVPR